MEIWWSRGQDLGAVVQQVFGYYEYEWVWTIRAADLPNLDAALGVTFDRLEALAEKFGGGNAAQLGPFLKANAIPCESWSRTDD